MHEMYRGRISGRQLSKWIQSYIVSHAEECCSVGKKVKVIRNIDHLPDGSVVKKTTDGWVTISTIFQAGAVSEAFDKYDGEEPNWKDALLIIKKFKITFQCTPKEPHGEYLLVVDEFSVWDLQEGFSLKYDLTNCMWIPEIRSLAAEERKKMAEESQHRRGEFDHLLDLMSQYSQSQGPATVDNSGMDKPVDGQETSAANNNRNIQRENTDAPDHNGTIIPASVLEQLRRPFSAREFLIPESQWKVLEDLSDWQSQGVSSQSPRRSKSESGNAVQFLGISMTASDNAPVVRDCKNGSSAQSSHRQKDAQPGTSSDYVSSNPISRPGTSARYPGQFGTSTHYAAVPGTSKQMEDVVCSQISSQADVSAWHENIDSVQFSDESLDTNLHIDESYVSPNKADRRQSNKHTDHVKVRQHQDLEHTNWVKVDHELSIETEDRCKGTKELFKAVKLATAVENSSPLETGESSASVVAKSSKETLTSPATAVEYSSYSSASVVVISSKESTQGMELTERTEESSPVLVEDSPVVVGSSSEELSQEKVGNQKDQPRSGKAISSDDSLDFGSPLAKSTQVDRKKSPSRGSHRYRCESTGNLSSTSDKIENKLKNKAVQNKETPDSEEDSVADNVRVSEPTPAVIKHISKISNYSPSERHNKTVKLKNLLDKFQTVIGKTVQNLKSAKADAAGQGSIDSVTSSSEGVISPSPEADMSGMSQLSRSILRGVGGKGCDNLRKAGSLIKAGECDVQEKKTNDNVTESLPSQEIGLEGSNNVTESLPSQENRVDSSTPQNTGISTDVSRTSDVSVTGPLVVRDDLTLGELSEIIDGVTCDLSIKQEIETDNDGDGVAESNKKNELLENQDARGTRMGMKSKKSKPIYSGLSLKRMSNSSIKCTQKNAESVCRMVTVPVDTQQVHDREMNSIQQSNLNSPEDGLYASTQPFEVCQSDTCGNVQNENSTQNTSADLLIASPISSPESQVVVHTQPFEVYPVGTQRFSPDQSCERVHSSTSSEETSFVGYGLRNKNNRVKNKSSDNSNAAVCKKRKANEVLTYLQNTGPKKRKGDIYTCTNVKIRDNSETLPDVQNENPGEDRDETEKVEMTKLKEKQYAVNLTRPHLAKTLVRDSDVDLPKNNQMINSNAEKQRKRDAQIMIDLTEDDDTKKTDLTENEDTQKTDLTDVDDTQKTDLPDNDDTQKTDLPDNDDTQKTDLTDDGDTQKTDTSSESHSAKIVSQENIPASTRDRNEIETDKITIDGHSFGDKTQWMNFIDSPYQKSVSEPKKGVSKSMSTYNRLRLQKNLEERQEKEKFIGRITSHKRCLDRVCRFSEESSKAANESSKAKKSYWISKSMTLKAKRRHKTDDIYEYPSSSTLTESNGSQSSQENVGRTLDSSQDSRSSTSSVMVLPEETVGKILDSSQDSRSSPSSGIKLSEAKQAGTHSRSDPVTSGTPAKTTAQEMESEEDNTIKNCLEMFLASLEVQPETEVGRRLQNFKLELPRDLYQDFEDTCKEL